MTTVSEVITAHITKNSSGAVGMMCRRLLENFERGFARTHGWTKGPATHREIWWLTDDTYNIISENLITKRKNG